MDEHGTVREGLRSPDPHGPDGTADGGPHGNAAGGPAAVRPSVEAGT